VEQHLVPVPPDSSLAQFAETVCRAQNYAARAKYAGDAFGRGAQFQVVLNSERMTSRVKR
jgi:hypothetical protein